MRTRNPIAFISYVRSDDQHDYGKISELRERIEGEVKIQTGRTFDIFQDRNDIRWGDEWKARLDGAILDVTFLIPIITPSYFNSSTCRYEFEKFLLREKTLGVGNLIFPIHYVDSEQLDSKQDTVDGIATVLRARNWIDWRPFRFLSMRDQAVAELISRFATDIKLATKELEAIAIVTQEKANQVVVTEKWAPHEVGLQEPVLIDLLPPPDFVELNQIIDEETKKNTYSVFTRVFDEVLEPISLTDANELVRLQRQLLKYSRECMGPFGGSAKELSYILASKGLQSSAAITILIDNSGSMRGGKIRIASAWSYIIAQALELIGCKVEVLGFTTRAWKGGSSRERWLSEKKPKNPGRLNDLRHIIYKDFETQMTQSLLNFGFMLREGILKENVDGEALLWSHSRLLETEASRRILIVLSDGAPVDDSTLSANVANYLHRHLIEVVRAIESEKIVELKSIGLEFDTSRYYSNSTTVTNSLELGKALSNCLSQD